MATQNSIISYVPQPYFISGSTTVSDYYDTDTIENADGLFDPDLSNYTVVIPDVGTNEFGIRVRFYCSNDHLDALDATIALIGCSMLTYADDGGGSPDYDTEFSEDIICAVGQNIGTQGNQIMTLAHNSQNSVNTFGKTPLSGIISGGQTNLIFNDIETFNPPISFSFANFGFPRNPDDVTARPHARLILGHFFVGVNLPITIDPNSYGWYLGLETNRFYSRDKGAISSDGTIVRQATGQIIKIDNKNIVGTDVVDVSGNLISELTPNFFDLTKVNNSYPVLFSPYTMPYIGASGITAEEANGTVRQNFYSIYGFMDAPFEFTPSEYRDGLASEYKARFRIQETR